LIQEKPYDSIVVQEILERANVGRSTFYTHFHDKADLLVGVIHDMLSAQATAVPPSTAHSERLLWFSLPVFERLERHRHTSHVRIETNGWARVHERLQQVLTHVIAEDLGKELQLRRKMRRPIPTDLLAHYVASTFVLVLTWWVESRSPLLPNEINDLFRSLIAPSLAAVLD
jgi:AcrR family transcriptional regulator